MNNRSELRSNSLVILLKCEILGSEIEFLLREFIRFVGRWSTIRPSRSTQSPRRVLRTESLESGSIWICGRSELPVFPATYSIMEEDLRGRRQYGSTRCIRGVWSGSANVCWASVHGSETSVGGSRTDVLFCFLSVRSQWLMVQPLFPAWDQVGFCVSYNKQIPLFLVIFSV